MILIAPFVLAIRLTIVLLSTAVGRLLAIIAIAGVAIAAATAPAPAPNPGATLPSLLVWRATAFNSATYSAGCDSARSAALFDEYLAPDLRTTEFRQGWIDGCETLRAATGALTCPGGTGVAEMMTDDAVRLRLRCATGSGSIDFVTHWETSAGSWFIRSWESVTG